MHMHMYGPVIHLLSGDELSDVQKDRAELKQQLSAEQRKREELEKSVETLTASEW